MLKKFLHIFTPLNHLSKNKIEPIEPTEPIEPKLDFSLLFLINSR